MSTTTEKTKKLRGPQERFYIDPKTDEMTSRYKGATEICDVTDIPDHVWHRLAQEGYIRFSRLGKSHAEIAAGQAFPDRTPPGSESKVAKKAALTEADKAARKAALKAARRDATREKKALIARLLAEHEAKNAAGDARADKLSQAAD